MRVVDGLFLALAIGGAAYVYNVKHEAEEAHDLRRSLERDIAVMSRDVSLLEADLAALEQPARLQGLVATLPQSFDLEPIAARHYLRISDIPFRSDAPDPVIEDEETVAIAGDGAEIVRTERSAALDSLVQTLADDVPVVPAADLDSEAAIVQDGDGIGALLEGAQ